MSGWFSVFASLQRDLDDVGLFGAHFGIISYYRVVLHQTTGDKLREIILPFISASIVFRFSYFGSFLSHPVSVSEINCRQKIVSDNAERNDCVEICCSVEIVRCYR